MSYVRSQHDLVSPSGVTRNWSARCSSKMSGTVRVEKRRTGKHGAYVRKTSLESLLAVRVFPSF